MSSPRRRRTVLRLLAVAGVGAVAATIALLPSRTPSKRDTALRPGAPEVVRTPREVPLTPARRRQIDGLLDHFIANALRRTHLDLVRSLVTPSFATGATAAQWRRGDIPVLPYKPRDSRFRGWRTQYSYPREVSLDVLVHPSAKEKLGAVAFTAVVRRTGEGWKVAEFVPAASFASEKKPPRILAQPDFQPNAPQGARTRARLGAPWLLLPVGVLALIALIPIVVIVRTKWKDRRAIRNYRGLYDRA